MPKRTVDLNAPFQRIPATARITGLSQSDIRRGCKSGRYPYIMSGRDFLINVPLLLTMLEEESKEVLRMEGKA